MTPSVPFSTGIAPARVVINTRPVERAAPLTAHLQMAGFSVVDIPMLALQPRTVSETDIDIMRQWLAGEYQALVIVSPTAAASGLAVWQQLRDLKDKAKLTSSNDKPQNEQRNKPSSSSVLKAPSHIIAVGQATAAVLAGECLPIRYDVLQPILANNEGMLAMPEINLLQAGDKLLVWRGLGGRRLLVDTLQARGVHIDSIAWYERIMPEAASVQYQHWQQHFNTASRSQDKSRQSQSPAPTKTQSALQAEKPIVIVSSGTAFEHWLHMVAQSQVSASDTLGHQVTPLTLNDFCYVVLGTRLANMVAARQLDYWQVEDLAPTTILAAISS
ncbi:uroporphyrinogen-III synthase [Psychrobacter sp. GP33]|uniref:uroporphyrinogen-III synthase n=1 Tax=Psychrobacter sp. GP33 TaxID=2758709 RepID=UPI0015FDAF6A|nr:uroporphyrinogen-III synthase [Psychrobacter sp. GP33]